MKIRVSLILFFCLIGVFSNAKGIWGSYEVSGKAYDAEGALIRNGEITLEIKGQQETIKTDSLGNYQFSIGYATACPSVVRGIKKRRANNKLNPKFITLKYADQEVKVKNKWRKYMSKRTRKLDVSF